MKPLHIALITCLLLAATIAGYSLQYLLSPAQSDNSAALTAEALIGKAASDFSLPDLNNQMRSFSEWHGKILLINFWATWCAPCRDEIPAFIRVRERFHPQGFEVIGIAIDRPGMVAEFAYDFGINYPMLYGQENAIMLGQQYGNHIGTLPYSVIIDHEGYIQHIHSRGVLTEADLTALIQPLLEARPDIEKSRKDVEMKQSPGNMRLNRVKLDRF